MGSAGGVGSARGTLSAPPTTRRRGEARRSDPQPSPSGPPAPNGARLLPVPVHLSPAAPDSRPPPAASGCSSEPPPPFCTGGRSHGTNPHCPRARLRRRTPAPLCRPAPWSRAEEASLMTTLAGRGEGASKLGTADTVTEPQAEQQPPPPRSVYLRLTIPPPPAPSLDRPASAAFLIGHPKQCPSPGLVRLGEGPIGPPPKVRSSLWLATLDKARAPPPLSNW